MLKTDFIVDFGKRQLAPVERLEVVSHDDIAGKNSTDRVKPLQVSSTLSQQNGINYLRKIRLPILKMQKMSIRAAS